MSKSIGIGSVVRFKGISPFCECPERHKAGGRAIGVVDGIIERNEIVDAHVIHVASPTGSGFARFDELEPVDEWGTSSATTDELTISREK